MQYALLCDRVIHVMMEILSNKRPTAEDLTMDENNAMIQLSGLWLNESKNGNKYMVGYLGENRLMVFKNQFKERENQPDYIIYIVPPRKNPTDNDDAAPF